MDDWLIIVLVSVPTIVALYYMVKANRKSKTDEVIIRIELDRDKPDENGDVYHKDCWNTDATQTEWEFKQYRTN